MIEEHEAEHDTAFLIDSDESSVTDPMHEMPQSGLELLAACALCRVTRGGGRIAVVLLDRADEPDLPGGHIGHDRRLLAVRCEAPKLGERHCTAIVVDDRIQITVNESFQADSIACPVTYLCNGRLRHKTRYKHQCACHQQAAGSDKYVCPREIRYRT
jgi:hypothetical protein